MFGFLKRKKDPEPGGIAFVAECFCKKDEDGDIMLYVAECPIHGQEDDIH